MHSVLSDSRPAIGQQLSLHFHPALGSLLHGGLRPGRYDGLSLLVFSGGRFFFLHDGWTSRDGTVIVLQDDNSVRIEFKR